MTAERHPDTSATPGASLPTPVRCLLSLTSPPAELPYLLDDLAEELGARTATHGRCRALAWAISQTVRSLGPLALARLRERRTAGRTGAHGDAMLTRLSDDLRYSLRVAARRPWLSLTLVATMALGIGTTTAVFSVIDALLLRPLAFPEPDRLVRLASPIEDAPGAMVVNVADLTDLAAETHAIASMGVYDSGDPLMLPATMAVLLVVTAAAAWIPAGYASRVDPLLAIRAE
jgi:hypothetical protein